MLEAGCPVCRIFRIGPRCASGLPRSARVCRAGDGSASCPAAPVHGLCRWTDLRVSSKLRVPRRRRLARLRVAPRLAALLRRRWVPGSPRFPHRPALPVAEFRVASILASVRRCRLTGVRVAPYLGLSVSPMIRASGRPEPRIPRLRLVLLERTRSAPSGGASGSIAGSPRIAFRRSRLRKELAGRPVLPFRWRRRTTPFPSRPEAQAFGAADGLLSGFPRIASSRLVRLS
jgi:hypothetical protein